MASFHQEIELDSNDPELLNGEIIGLYESPVESPSLKIDDLEDVASKMPEQSLTHSLSHLPDLDLTNINYVNFNLPSLIHNDHASNINNVQNIVVTPKSLKTNRIRQQIPQADSDRNCHS